jgi:FlaA1/EpsC-like NDP-sugar epimerase
MSTLLAFSLRFDGKIPPDYFQLLLLLALPKTIVFLITFIRFGLYRQIWLYANFEAFVSVVSAVTLAAIIFNGLLMFTGFLQYPYTVSLISYLVTLVMIGGVRFSWRIVREKFVNKPRRPQTEKRVLILGAGDAGVTILQEILHNQTGYLPVGFIDDIRSKQGMVLHGVKVLGRRRDIPELVNKHHINEVLIAIPSATSLEMRRIVATCQRAKVRLKTLPPVSQLLNGQSLISTIREVREEDLLAREEIKFNAAEIQSEFEGKVILITGAGGSIGSELSRQLAACRPQKILLLGHGENSIFSIEQELKTKSYSFEIIPIIADIRDRERINEVIGRERPNFVFHAAAHKHVYLMELCPEEAYKNNVLGTKNVAEACLQYKVNKFVLISTDKAVYPTSVMGRTKREAEQLICSLASLEQTKFIITRFGNVLNSRGSVIPIFKKQIAQGGPVTVTHPEVERYFMTIPEAVQLVIRAAIMGNGGEIFVLDMGSQVKIFDLAKNLITLSGFEVDKEIEIKITGLKPGEKMKEVLNEEDEVLVPTLHQKIKKIKISTKPQGVPLFE